MCSCIECESKIVYLFCYYKLYLMILWIHVEMYETLGEGHRLVFVINNPGTYLLRNMNITLNTKI
jgi:hypothetical protein